MCQSQITSAYKAMSCTPNMAAWWRQCIRSIHSPNATHFDCHSETFCFVILFSQLFWNCYEWGDEECADLSGPAPICQDRDCWVLEQGGFAEGHEVGRVFWRGELKKQESIYWYSQSLIINQVYLKPKDMCMALIMGTLHPAKFVTSIELCWPHQGTIFL